MGLAEYRHKRKFEQTPEPSGKRAQKKENRLRFVVQKHRASHLHYDFRLELDGVLKSWAIPKGPSMQPTVRRYAVEVEDHPLSYRSFEGIIPKGNYGAGKVEIWDEGTYEAPEVGSRSASEKTLKQGLKRGHLSFVLHGNRLEGEFSLVKIKEKGWLLIKKKATAKRAAPAKPARRVKASSKATATAFVAPMLATLVSVPFDGADWIFELKWDGYRAIAETGPRGARLYSRSQKSFEKKYPEIYESLREFRRSAIFDGEIVAIDEKGKSSFQLLQNYPRTHQGELVYYVFDLLELDGKDLRELPLEERKEKLRSVLVDLPHVRYSDHIEKDGKSFFKTMQAQGVEGMVAKKADSRYREGERSPDWLKVKARLEQEVVIAGYTDPKGARKRFGALLVGVYEKGKLVYAGRVGTGFNQESLEEVYARMKPLAQKQSPFDGRVPGGETIHWIRPELVGEISFHEWTDEGLVRQAAFLGFREDKKATSVIREIPSSTEAVVKGKPNLKLVKNEAMDPRPATSARRFSKLTLASPKSSGLELEVDGHLVKLTHLEKPYWPEEGYTKGDVINYYRQIAPLILPYLKDRPEGLHRQPNGAHDGGFFQQSMDQRTPDWVKIKTLPAEGGDKHIRYAVCQNEATLLYLANLGCIELNPWFSRIGHLDRPDYLVLDLDPSEVSFASVLKVALSIRDLLQEMGAEGYCKTSGKRGLHVYVPLGARYEYSEVKKLAEILSHLVHERSPKLTSLEHSKAKRRRKVYLDFMRNARGQTVAAPYSLRPCPGAPVSAPLTWEEVESGVTPTDFTIRTICRRLDRKGDLFAPVLGPGIDLAACLERLSRRSVK